jgi:hypothetical protein
MNLQQIFDYCNNIANKEQTGATCTPAQFQSYIEAANIDYYNLKLGLPQEYRPGQPIPRQAWELTNRMTEDMRRFKVIMGGETTAPATLDSHGQMLIPTDYWMVSSIRYRLVKNTESCGVLIKWRDVDVLKDADFNNRVVSTLKAPDMDYPVCCFYADYIQYYPKTLQFVTFTYLRKPATPVYGFTIANDTPVYDATTSVQFEFPEFDHLDICRLILSYMGINIREQALIQYAELIKNKGV